MADRKTHFLVTLVFDENLYIGRQIDTERLFKNEIIKDLQHLVKGREIKHFVVADDAVINDKLKQEPKTGYWIDDKCSVCGKGTEDLIDSREWYQNEEPKYCPFCGVKLVDS